MTTDTTDAPAERARPPGSRGDAAGDAGAADRSDAGGDDAAADRGGDSEAGAPHTCGYCGQRFARAEWLALHRGLAHPDRLTDEERAAYETANEHEEERLRLYRLRALGALVVLYFGFLITFALVL